jgi:hypothetical protein
MLASAKSIRLLTNDAVLQRHVTALAPRSIGAK